MLVLHNLHFLSSIAWVMNLLYVACFNHSLCILNIVISIFWFNLIFPGGDLCTVADLGSSSVCKKRDNHQQRVIMQFWPKWDFKLFLLLAHLFLSSQPSEQANYLSALKSLPNNSRYCVWCFLCRLAYAYLQGTHWRSLLIQLCVVTCHTLGWLWDQL